MVIFFRHDSIIKEALCCSGDEIQTQNFDIYNINEVIIQTQKYLYFLHLTSKLFSEES